MPPKPNARTTTKGAVSKLSPRAGRSSRTLQEAKTARSRWIEDQTNLQGSGKQGEFCEAQSKLCSSNAALSATSPHSLQNPARSKTSPKKGVDEKRQRRFRSKPPASFDVKLHRARTQRMIVVERRRSATESGTPAEDIDVVGSTGNIYTVHIGHVASCTCPDSLKGNECKHKVYALHTVLKAPTALVYQLAFLGSELEQIFASAPPIPSDIAEGQEDDPEGRRKSLDGECPVCYMELDPEHNQLVWCKSQCGHNVHKSCFDQWAASQRGKEVRCIYCRTPWQVESGNMEAVKGSGQMGEDGYVNVADHFGMSRSRDYSGYHQPWVRRQFGHGW